MHHNIATVIAVTIRCSRDVEGNCCRSTGYAVGHSIDKRICTTGIPFRRICPCAVTVFAERAFIRVAEA